MDDRTHEIYNDSFQRCLAKPDFFAHFYDLLTQASPLIREKFKDTDLKQQARIIKKSLYALTLASVGTQVSKVELERIGRSHGKYGLRIQPEMYDMWLSCLLETVKTFDVGWTPEVEQCWRNMLEPHLTALKQFT